MKLLRKLEKNNVTEISNSWKSLFPLNRKSRDSIDFPVFLVCGVDGFSCGVWNMFHFITVAAEELYKHHLTSDQIVIDPSHILR